MTGEGLKEKRVLVVGAGIAGIQAALDLAEAGISVVLAERGDSIGGRMAQTDKTFPTLDCSSCTLTPRTADAGNHPNIRLLTRTTPEDVRRRGSGFVVSLKKNPRFVDPGACVACGKCAEACRMAGRVRSTFDLGLKKISAVGMPFPQAVPMSYAVDAAHCLFLSRGKCGKSPACADACSVNAIHFDEREMVEELAVDGIILATGYELYRPDDEVFGRPELGYGKYPEVLTNLQFERLSSASGPTGGKLKIAGKEPRSIVFLQCVGSRDKTTGASYCSRVCCMASLKQAVLALEKLPGVEITVLYMDMRAFGKGYEEFMERAQRMGAVLRRGNPSEVYRAGDSLAVRFEDTFLKRPMELKADAVILAAGLRPGSSTSALSGIFGVPLGADGFFEHANPLDPSASPVQGIYVAGAAGGPMDIPDAVASGSAVAGACLASFLAGEHP